MTDTTPIATDAAAIEANVREHGYCRVPKALPQEPVAAALDRVRALHAGVATRSEQADVPELARGDPYVWSLQNKDAKSLDLLFSVPTVQTALLGLLNDPWYKHIPADQSNYILRSFLARSSRNPLPLHIDAFVPYGGDHVFVLQVAIILQDQSPENGCTLVVPGSHHAGRYASKDDLPNARPVPSEAGDIVIWDSRLWHGAGANESEEDRWAMIATYTRWWIKQAFDIPRNLPAEIYKGLTPAQRAVLGFCSVPYATELEGIDVRKGLDYVDGADFPGELR